MFLKIAVLLVAIFVGNVTKGAFTGTPFFEDLGEMLLLLVASIFFVVAVLQKETDLKQEVKNQKKPGSADQA